MPKMTTPHRTSSSDSDNIRKRVGKACDRCRLKKSKCDGSSPCSRCKADNAICVFGERKKSHDKVYPKGYVEMLEQQQSQLVAGLQETYRRLAAADLWPGAQLSESNGNPLTHDILAGLDLLELKQDGSGEVEMFEEDCQKLQQRLVSDGAPFVGRRGSFSSESDHDQSHSHIHSHRNSHSRSHSEQFVVNSSHTSADDTQASSRAQPVFEEGWNFQSSPSPITLSPPPKMKKALSASKPSPLSHESVVSQNDYMIPVWHTVGNGNNVISENMLRSQFALQTPAMQDNLQAVMENYNQALESAPEPEHGTMGFNQYGSAFPMFNPQDWMINDSMDVDFSKFVQVST